MDESFTDVSNDLHLDSSSWRRSFMVFHGEGSPKLRWWSKQAWFQTCLLLFFQSSNSNWDERGWAPCLLTMWFQGQDGIRLVSMCLNLSWWCLINVSWSSSSSESGGGRRGGQRSWGKRLSDMMRIGNQEVGQNGKTSTKMWTAKWRRKVDELIIICWIFCTYVGN